MEYLDLVLSVITHPLYVMFAIGHFIHSVSDTNDMLSTFARVISSLFVCVVWPMSVVALTVSHYKLQGKYIIRIHKHLIEDKDHD